MRRTLLFTVNWVTETEISYSPSKFHETDATLWLWGFNWCSSTTPWLQSHNLTSSPADAKWRPSMILLKSYFFTNLSPFVAWFVRLHHCALVIFWEKSNLKYKLLIHKKNNLLLSVFVLFFLSNISVKETLKQLINLQSEALCTCHN